MAKTNITAAHGEVVLPITASECRAMAFGFLSRAQTLGTGFNARCCESAAFSFDGAAHALDAGLVDDARASFILAHRQLAKIQA